MLFCTVRLVSCHVSFRLKCSYVFWLAYTYITLAFVILDEYVNTKISFSPTVYPIQLYIKAKET